MIVAYSNEWVLYTPTKCGTYSLEATLMDTLELGVKVRPRHRMDIILPDTTRRYMMTRHPIERWASIYWAIKRWSKSGHPYMWQFSESPQVFAEEWVKRMHDKPYPMFTFNNTQNARLCQPERVFKLEAIYEVADFFGFDRDLVKHRNHTKDRPSAADTLRDIASSLVKEIEEWARPDLEAWYS